KQRTLADAIRFFEEAEVTAGPVYDIGQFLEDPHVQARGIVVETPDEEMGEVPMHAVVPRLSGTPGPLRYPAPAVGQHNREIFSPLVLPEHHIHPPPQKEIIRRRPPRTPADPRSSCPSTSGTSWRRPTTAVPMPSCSISRTRCRPRRRRALGGSSRTRCLW